MTGPNLIEKLMSSRETLEAKAKMFEARARRAEHSRGQIIYPWPSLEGEYIHHAHEARRTANYYERVASFPRILRPFIGE